MRIVIDEDFDGQGNVIAQHIIHTELVMPTLAVMATAVSGWQQITKLAAYPGKTRFQAFQGEAVRLNDPLSRALLGV